MPKKIFIVLLFLAQIAHTKEINVALITDGPTGKEADSLGLIRKNLNKIMSNPQRVKLRKVNIFNTGLDEKKLKSVVNKIMTRKDIDLVIALGPKAGAYVSHKDFKIKIPTIAAPI